MAYQPGATDPTKVMGRRILGFAVDSILGFVLVAVVFLAVAERVDTRGLAPTGPDYCSRLQESGGFVSCFALGDEAFYLEGADNLPVLLAGLGFVLVNYVLLQGLTGASIGKHMTGLRVVNARGEIAGVGRSIVRTLLYVVDTFCFYVVGLVTALASKGHRRVGDMVASTYVVRADAVGAAPGPQPGPLPGWQPPAGPGGWTPPPGPA